MTSPGFPKSPFTWAYASWDSFGGQLRTIPAESELQKSRPRAAFGFYGADNGVRSRDPHLGKVVLYQLSHVRIAIPIRRNKQMEATPGFEPGVKALQASALPLGHVALKRRLS